MSVSTDNIDSPSQRIKTQGCVLREVLFRQFKGLATGLPVVIPSYQRAYCWSMDDIQKVFDDIDSLRLTDNGYEATDYYLGAIAFQKASGDAKKDGKQKTDHLLLLDGQQRLTSLILWINALHETLTLHDPNGEQIPRTKRQILEELCSDPTSAFEYKQPKSYRHMAEIYQTIKGSYEVLYQQDKALTEWRQTNLGQDLQIESQLWVTHVNADLKRLAYMLGHALFAVTVFNNQYEATQYFMGENHRGVPMSLIDKVKSYHLRYVPDFERDQVFKAWQWVDKDLGNDAKHEASALSEFFLPMQLFLMNQLPSETKFWQEPSLFDYFKGFYGSKKQDRWVDHKAHFFARSNDLNGAETERFLNRRSLDLSSELTSGTPFFIRLLYATVLLRAIHEVTPLEDGLFGRTFKHETLLRKAIYFALVFWADCFLKTDSTKDVLDRLAVIDQGWNEALFEQAVEVVQQALRKDLSFFYRYYLLWVMMGRSLLETFSSSKIGEGHIIYWISMHDKVRSALAIPYRYADPSKACRALMHYALHDVAPSWKLDDKKALHKAFKRQLARGTIL